MFAQYVSATYVHARIDDFVRSLSFGRFIVVDWCRPMMKPMNLYRSNMF